MPRQSKILSIQMKGFVKTKNRVDALPRTVYEGVAKKLSEITNWLAYRSKLNAPILTGALRASIHATTPVRKGHLVQNEIKSELPYALRLHEHPFKLGPRSAQQASTVEGGVGNKYISRVVEFYRGWMEYEWQKWIDNLPLEGG